MQKFLLPLLALLALNSSPVWADKSQNHAEIRKTVAAFVRAQTQTLPGKVTIEVAEIDRHIVLPACPALEAFLPPGTQLNGNSSVGVRCISKHAWSLFVQVNVKTSLNILTANKTLQLGQTVRAEDLSSINSDTLQSGALTEPEQAVGKIMKYGIAAGQILRHDMLRAPYTVKQGQTVQIRITGAGFRINSEGHALNNAAEGGTASVRTVSGQTVSGIVKGGIIEISQ